MEKTKTLEIGVRVRCKKSGIVGIVVDKSDFIGVCRVEYYAEGRACRIWVETENLNVIKEGLT